MPKSDHPKFNEFLGACFDDLSKAEEMLRSDSTLITRRSSHVGETALHYCAIEDKQDAVELLIRLGADINAKDESGDTPLMSASIVGAEAVVKLLLRHAADVRHIGETTGSALHAAAQSSHPAIVRLILAAGADIEAQDSNLAMTPLHCAAMFGDAETIQSLLENGANVRARGLFDREPLHFAAESGSIEKCQLLLDAGADVNSESLTGTPLLHGDADNCKLLDLLISRGAK